MIMRLRGGAIAGRTVRGSPRGVWLGLGILSAMLALTGCEHSGSSGSGGEPGAYTVTVYYTAVESYHGGAAQKVRGCLTRDCEFGSDDLGTYPASFAEAVRTEGTGRITSGPHAGRYLNWSSDTGYWLDAVPADAYGGALKPFQTAAADPGVLARGTRFRLIATLIQDDGQPLDPSVAGRFLSATWIVEDQFTPGLGGQGHLDLYIGEENQPDFTSTSPLYTTLQNVKIEVR